MASLVEESEEQRDRSLNMDIADLDYRASVHYRSGEYGDCVDVLRKSYNLRVKILGAKHVDSLMNLNNLGAALGRLGLRDEAEHAFRDALSGRMEVRGKVHSETFTSMNHLGVLLKQSGHFNEAEALLYTSLEGFHKTQGFQHIRTAEVAFSYGVLSVQQGKRNKAAYMFSLATSGLTVVLGSAHQHTKDAAFWETKCKNTYSSLTAAQKKQMKKKGGHEFSCKIPAPESPLPSVFEIEEFDYAEGIYESRQEWMKQKQCSVCSVKYTLTRREHHCRVCSSSVCGDCSQATTYVMDPNSQPDKADPTKARPTLQRCCSTCEAQGFT